VAYTAVTELFTYIDRKCTRRYKHCRLALHNYTFARKHTLASSFTKHRLWIADWNHIHCCCRADDIICKLLTVVPFSYIPPTPSQRVPRSVNRSYLGSISSHWNVKWLSERIIPSKFIINIILKCS